MRKVDLNVDIGEGFPNDEALLEFATSANVCCGEHAGSWELTVVTVEMCRAKGRRVGMHPGYPDRKSMGREPMPIELREEYTKSLSEQMGRFGWLLKASYVKPHGAYYNETAIVLPDGWDDVHDLVSEGSSYQSGTVVLFELPGGGPLLDAALSKGALMGLPGTAHEEFARRAPCIFIREGFADRAYRPDGTLVPRTEPGAVLEDPDQIRRQVLELAQKVDSICLHGDTPNCLQFAEMVYKTLTDNGYEVGY